MKVDYDLVGGDGSFARICKEIESQKYWKYYNGTLGKVVNHPLIEDDPAKNYLGHGVPPMNELFYGIYGKTGSIPEWEHSFMDRFIEKWTMPNPYKNSSDPMWIGEYTFKHNDPRFHYGFDLPPLKKKLVRTYMSFLKEQHVMHWLFDKGLKSAYWSLYSDNIMGFDIMVCNPKYKWYGIKVYSDTNSAKMYAYIKEHSRHAAEKGICSIAIPVPMNKDMLGDTFIVPEKTLLCMYNIIMNGIETNTITKDAYGRIQCEPGIILGGTKWIPNK